jgi:hypothetical protein
VGISPVVRMQCTDSSGISRRANNSWRITHRWEDQQYFMKRSLHEFIPKHIMSPFCTEILLTVCEKVFNINSFIFGNMKPGFSNMTMYQLINLFLFSSS